MILMLISASLLYCVGTIERFSIECLKTKTRVNTEGNQKKRKYLEEPIQIQSKKSNVRENAGDQVVIGCSFVSDWLREWREFSGPITERSEVKTKTISDYFRHSIQNIFFFYLPLNPFFLLTFAFFSSSVSSAFHFLFFFPFSLDILSGVFLLFISVPSSWLKKGSDRSTSEGMSSLSSESLTVELKCKKILWCSLHTS